MGTSSGYNCLALVEHLHLEGVDMTKELAATKWAPLADHVCLNKMMSIVRRYSFSLNTESLNGNAWRPDQWAYFSVYAISKAFCRRMTKMFGWEFRLTEYLVKPGGGKH